MGKLLTFIILFISFLVYTGFVYTKGTNTGIIPANKEEILAGKKIFQDHNCVSCHQVFGLGGYLGTDLTNSYSDKNRGPAYMRALLQSGSERMPVFGFNEKQIDALIAYLKHVDHISHNKVR